MASFIQRHFHFKHIQAPPETLYSSPQAVGTVTGYMMIFIAFLGLFWPDFLGLNLSIMHCFVLGASGVVSIFGNLSKSAHISSVVNFILGVFFLLNALLGALVGEPGHARFKFYTPEQLQRVAPGFLELAMTDHMIHAAIGLVFLSEAFYWRYHYLHRPFIKPEKRKIIFRFVGILLALSMILTANYFILKAQY
jgi:hypothetical protein